MSLYWKLHKVSDVKELQDEKNATITQMIGLGFAVACMSELTEDNWREYYARLRLVEQLSGGGFLMAGDDNRIDLNPAWVRRRIGMTANVSDLTRDEWLQENIGSYLDDLIITSEVEGGVLDG